MATAVEGHPDNVAATMWGGFAIVGRDGSGKPRAVRFDTPDTLHATVFIPDAAMRTAEMRAALPTTVPHKDAAHNVGRAALVVAALTSGRLELLDAMSDDRLHEPFRAQFLPQLPALTAAAREAGALGAALSGAGSAVMALSAEAETADRVAAAMTAAALANDLPGRAIVVRPAAHGARVIRRGNG